MSAPTAPLPVGALLAPVVRDLVAGLKALIAEADSGVRRCDPARGPNRSHFTSMTSPSRARRGPLRR